MTNNLYHYKATVVRVVDGDTAELMIHLGFTIVWRSTCRFYGINTPELRSKDAEERAKAKEARALVEQYLAPGSVVYIKSHELDKYGRPLVSIYCGEEQLKLNDKLVELGLAKSYIL